MASAVRKREEAEPAASGQNRTEAARPRDPQATQARILAAAKAEFAKKGLAGARVDAIAAKAKINKRMIYHYFHSKDDLFLAVLEEAYGDIRAAERKLDLENLDAEAAIAKLATFTWTYYLKNPEFLRLINSENLHKAAHLKRSQKIKEMHSPFVELIQGILERGVAEGKFRPGLDADQVYISMAALGYYYLTNRYTLSVVYGVDLGTKDALEKRLAVIVDTVLSYLRKG
ncbi:MAG: TetR/AcrR family transcriptional regulator [Geminicoccaceae bacterium]